MWLCYVVSQYYLLNQAQFLTLGSSYICRADIGTVGYRHFCQHFRVTPGTPCAECDSCNLYAQEDEAFMIREAAKAAEGEYWRHNNKPQGWKSKSTAGVGRHGLNGGFCDLLPKLNLGRGLTKLQACFSMGPFLRP